MTSDTVAHMIAEALMHVAVYAGVPAANHAITIANATIAIIRTNAIRFSTPHPPSAPSPSRGEGESMNTALLIFPLPLRERVPRRGGRGAD